MGKILTREVMNALFIALNTSLNKGLEQAWDGYRRWSNEIPSGSAGEKYPMSIVTGGMREWIGERVVNRLSAEVMTVLHRDFERTEGVSRNDIEDDNIGFYHTLFQSMGIDAGNLSGQLAAAALLDTSAKWADGSAFYSSTRKLGKATYNNVVQEPLSVSSYETARAQMMGFKATNNKGQPLGLVPDLLVVESLETAAKRILVSSLVVQDGVAVDNIHKDECAVQVNPYISGSQWFLMCTGRGIKPVSVQKRKEGSLQRWAQDSDTCVKDKNENHYGVHYRGESVATSPFLVIGGNLS